MQWKYCLLLLFLASAACLAQSRGSASVNPNEACRLTGEFGESSQVVAAWVGGNPIYLADVDASLGREGYLLRRQLYDLRVQALKNLIQKYLLSKEAKKSGLTEAELIEHITAKSTPINKLDVASEWATSIATLRSMGEIAAKYQIERTLTTRRKLEALDAHLQQLEQEEGVRIQIPRPQLALAPNPRSMILGNPDAPLTITVFLDYECPFCKRLDQELGELLSQEPFHSRLRISIKQFPLSSHPTATNAAVAAVCAAQQGKFSAMHARLFELQRIGHTDAVLIHAAEHVSLDIDDFRACLTSQSAGQEVLTDLHEGAINGVDATPSLFLNGQLLPSSDFAAVRRQLQAAMNSLEPSAPSQALPNPLASEGDLP